jgi:hypothetical protein
LCDICTHLHDKIIHGVESLLAAKASNELDAQFLAVEVTVEVQ